MKKSTKYLLCLIGSFILAAILFPLILHIVPQGNNDFFFNSFENIVDSHEHSEREIPMVDASITSIDFSKSIHINNLIITGVESPKDQQIKITVNSNDQYLDAIDIRQNGSSLSIADLNQKTTRIDSLVIIVANPGKLKFNINSINCSNLSVNDLICSTLDLKSNGYELRFNGCRFDVLSLDYSSETTGTFYISIRNSRINQAKVVTDNNFNMLAGNCIGHLSIEARFELIVSLKGYDGDVDLIKNNYKIFLDKE